jgi:ATP-dependent RNA helicase DeaD
LQKFLYMTTFEGLGLDSKLVKATDALGFTEPTPIQEQAIPVLLSGTKDLVGLAQTGTGKTAAFGLPLLQLTDAAKKYPQALVVCPTRELCMQIVNEIEQFSIWWIIHWNADTRFEAWGSDCGGYTRKADRPD